MCCRSLCGTLWSLLTGKALISPCVHAAQGFNSFYGNHAEVLLHWLLHTETSPPACRHSYEASAIASWLTKHGRSPMTNEEMSSKVVAPNNSLKAVIELLFPPN